MKIMMVQSNRDFIEKAHEACVYYRRVYSNIDFSQSSQRMDIAAKLIEAQVEAVRHALRFAYYTNGYIQVTDPVALRLIDLMHRARDMRMCTSDDVAHAESIVKAWNDQALDLETLGPNMSRSGGR